MPLTGLVLLQELLRPLRLSFHPAITRLDGDWKFFMNRYDKPVRPGWSLQWMGAFLGFFCGMGITLTFFILPEALTIYLTPAIYSWLRELSEFISTPGGVVMSLLGCSQGYTEGIEWMTISFAVVTNGAIASMVSAAVAGIWQNRWRIFLVPPLSKYDATAGNARLLRRRWCEFIVLGFLLGSLLTILFLIAPVTSRWFAFFWLLLGALGSKVAAIWGWDLRDLSGHGLMPILFSAFVNGIALALAAPVAFWLGRLLLKSSRREL